MRIPINRIGYANHFDIDSIAPAHHLCKQGPQLALLRSPSWSVMCAVELRTPIGLAKPSNALDRPLSVHCLQRQRWQRRQGAAASSSGCDQRAVNSRNSATSLLPCSAAFMAAVQPGNSGDREPLRTVDAATYLGVASAVHFAMTALGCVLGDAAGLHVTAQLAGTDLSLDLSLPAALKHPASGGRVPGG